MTLPTTGMCVGNVKVSRDELRGISKYLVQLILEMERVLNSSNTSNTIGIHTGTLFMYNKMSSVNNDR